VKYHITLLPNSGTEKYDGTEKTVTGFEKVEEAVETYSLFQRVKTMLLGSSENIELLKAEEEGLTVSAGGNTYTITGLTASGSGIDAGEYKICTTGTPVVKDEAGVDVTAQFYIDTTATGTLTITPRTVTLTSGSGEKKYDGTALTNSNVEISGEDGFVGEEGADYIVTGTQTRIGSSENTFSYVLKSNTKESNYEITLVAGVLTITEDSVDPNAVVTKTHKDAVYGLGDTITFTITVTNIYDEAKTITITEQEGVTLAKSVFKNVGAGEVISTTATYVVTMDDVQRGTYTNKVSASFDGGKTYEATDVVEDIYEPTYTLTIHYRDTAGRTLADDYIGSFMEGETFRIVSPTISGYRADAAAINSGDAGMPGRDLEFTVTYTAITTSTSTSTPGGGGSSTEEDTTASTSTTETTSDNTVQTTGTVTAGGTAAVPADAATEESVEMEITQDEDGNYVLTPVEDAETPLANLNVESDYHTCCALHFILMALSMIVLVFYTRSRKKHQKRIFELREKLGK
jgi:hypothetical protein